MAQLTGRCTSCNNDEKVKELIEGLKKISKSIGVFENLTKTNHEQYSSFGSASNALISDVRSVLVKSGIKTDDEPAPVAVVCYSTNGKFEEVLYDPWRNDGVQIKKEEMTDEEVEYNDDESAEDPSSEEITIPEINKIEDTGEGQEEDMLRAPSSSTGFRSVRHYKKSHGKVREVGKPSGRRTAYSFFVEECWGQIRKDLGVTVSSSVNFSKISRSCSMRWQELKKEEKRKYVVLAEEDTKRYQDEMKRYVPPDGKKKRKKKKSPYAPKRALTAFFLFCMDERPHIRSMKGNLTVPEVSKELSRRWFVTSAAVKEKYETISAKDRERYERHPVEEKYSVLLRSLLVRCAEELNIFLPPDASILVLCEHS